jgi:energy-coupling factor transport system ATP-binding protein
MKAISFEDVSFAYEENFLFEHLNFEVEEGEFVAVLGHNGSGKSTLARICDGLLTADKGKISVFGKPVEGKKLYDIRKEVGIVFQNPDNQAVASIVEDDVAFGAENIALPRKEIKERIDFALNAVGIPDLREATVSRLSGGQKQRVAIAGVLALKPKIMILDEATAMLDPRGRKEICDVVKKLHKEEGITVLFVTHFMEEALLADRAIVMNQGKIVMNASPKEIFSRSDELLKYGLTLPAIGYISKRLREGGLDVPDTLDIQTLAEEIKNCVSKRSI